MSCDQFHLSPLEKQFYDSHGYLLLKNVFSNTEVLEARRELFKLMTEPERAHPRLIYRFELPKSTALGVHFDQTNPYRIWMIQNTPLASDWWFQHALSPRIVDPVVDCIGPDVDFHGGMVRVKSPGYLSYQGWHQDWFYDRHTGPELVSAITYLEDTWTDAAATSVVPGTHKQGLWDHIDNMIPENAIPVNRVDVFAKAGDVLLVHVLLVHKAGLNKTTECRTCIINEYKSHNVEDRWGNTFALADMPIRRGGKPFT